MPLRLPLIRHLKSPDMFRTIDRMLALGAPASDRTFEVFNPSTGELLAELPTWASLSRVPRSIEPISRSLDGRR
ncbi:hypothetical protein [Mesorhizobium sp. BHbdii]